jgi:dTDP-4-amino-4,6-dideoxygalactose transaminase
LEGALGVAQLEILSDIIHARRKNAAYLIEHLKQFEEHIQLPKIREGAEHSFMMLPLVLRHETKQQLVSYLENNGIETREMLPLINQPAYQKLFQINENDYPVAKWINESGFYIATHQELTADDLKYIVEVFSRYFSQKLNSVKDMAGFSPILS